MKRSSVFLIVADVVAVLVLAVLIGYVFAGRHRELKDQKALDTMEVHYDADDLFIIADENTGLVGVYYGVKPIQYFYGEDMFKSDLDSIPYLIIGKDGVIRD